MGIIDFRKFLKQTGIQVIPLFCILCFLLAMVMQSFKGVANGASGSLQQSLELTQTVIHS
jgi:hypothetical protein